MNKDYGGDNTSINKCTTNDTTSVTNVKDWNSGSGGGCDWEVI